MPEEIGPEPNPEETTHPLIRELANRLSNPFHRRIVLAYRGPHPLQSMEHELSEILREVVSRATSVPEDSRFSGL